MAFQYKDLFTSEEISFLSNHSEVLKAKERLDKQKMVYFSLSLPESIRNSIQSKMGLNLSNVERVPMRWIVGDTLPHVDHGTSSFENTYLMYLTNSDGYLRVNNETYPIQEGCGYSFSEGLDHETIGTMHEPRLLIGPMSENGLTVGAYETIRYYSTKNGALSVDSTKLLATKYFTGNPTDYEVGQISVGSLNGISSWRIASNSTGISSQSITYQNGSYLNDSVPISQYYLYPGPTKPRNQREALQQSYALSPVWPAYKFYELNALKYGFARISFQNYRILYRKNKV